MSRTTECHKLMCFSCGEEHPQEELDWIDGADNRSPRAFCDECAEPAKKGYGDW